ncbi:FMN reductase [Microbacterium sp. BK668]|uniref:FMN reductase n=1 Tax=Microbacterium sp. BK668 TaxID=2512118 RepID=UPI0010E3C5BB|nr:FMN reductase [Microbacterium sp. BK668]TDN91909.1 FMN reductase [Microbacterium sp. BK668]
MTTIAASLDGSPTPAPLRAPLKVVGVSGSLHTPSKTTALVSAIIGEVASRARTESRLIELAEIGPSLAGVLHRADLPPDVAEALRAIEGADLLVVASPVYRASFTGLFKHLFDFVDQYALVGQPVLLAATGGGERHALIIEHQLRPLFGFFQAITLPLGVYASTADFDGHELRSTGAHQRIEQAVSRGLPLIEQAAQLSTSDYVSTW